jgi:penicillin-binding protein 1C
MFATKLSAALLAAALCGQACATILPTPAQVREGYRASEAQLLDRHGQPLQGLRLDMSVRRSQWVALSDVSPALTGAVLQAEDQRFYTHSGVDVQAMGKAAWDNVFVNPDHARGASTITMQLAGLLDPALHPQIGLNGRRTLGQKWDQIGTAREMEKSWNKSQVLETYLNLVSFRGETQGVGAASERLFAKAPSGLDQVEASILASLIRAPNADAKQVARRACALASDMHVTATCGVIEAELRRAIARVDSHHGHEAAGQVAQRLLKQPGERIVSTIDAGLQRHARQSVRQHLSLLHERNVGDAAVVVLDNRSGEILAYVGNAGDKNVDGVAALRQAGSTLKPFLYELAIEKQVLTAASVIDDAPLDVQTEGGLYVPQNYDKDFKGNVSVRTSLAGSLNVPAVKTLMLTGLDDFHERLQDVGFTSLTQPADYYGYSLALGSAEVSLLDLANAYRVFANGGMASSPTLTLHANAAPRRVLDARAAYIVGDILSDRAARSVTFGLSNELATPYWTAVKTGTSKDMRDNWCIGYSEHYTVGVWVGNFDGASMWDVSGVTGAAPIWRDVMDYLQRGSASHAPAMPAGVLARQIDFQPAVEAPRRELFMAGTETARVEIVGGAARTAKIRYPGDGDIIAIDPDIPDANQRVFFEAQSGSGLRWRLDDAALGSASEQTSWRPVAGKHRLDLVDETGKVRDSIAFSVRGVERRQALQPSTASMTKKPAT